MKKINYVFSDIDGTVLDTENKYSNDLVPAIKALAKFNIPLGIVTNRASDFTLDLYHKLNLTGNIIIEDGAKIINPRTLDSVLLIDNVDEINEFRENMDALLGKSWEHKGEQYILKSNNDKQYSLSIHVFSNSVPMIRRYDAVQFVLEELQQKFGSKYPGLSMYNTGRGNIFIGSQQASKANALEYLNDKEEIHLNKTCVIGDGVNDIPMFEIAKGAAVGNAIPELKRLAKFVSNKNYSNGVIDILNTYVMNND